MISKGEGAGEKMGWEMGDWSMTSRWEERPGGAGELEYEVHRAISE